MFHTSHPGLAAALRRDRAWVQTSANLFGDNKTKSRRSIRKVKKNDVVAGTGYGGHFRAVQGFRYVGGQQDKAALGQTRLADPPQRR